MTDSFRFFACFGIFLNYTASLFLLYFVFFCWMLSLVRLLSEMLDTTRPLILDVLFQLDYSNTLDPWSSERTERVLVEAALRWAKLLETGPYELRVASHAYQLALDWQQLEPELLEVQLDEVEVIGAGRDVIAATGRVADQANDAHKWTHRPLTTHCQLLAVSTQNNWSSRNCLQQCFNICGWCAMSVLGETHYGHVRCISENANKIT